MKAGLVTQSGLRIKLTSSARMVREYRLGPPPPPAARLLVVSPTGTSAGSATVGDPWSMEHALTQVVPGDTIQMRGGRYRKETGWEIAVSGTVTNPITITRYAAENPIIDGAVAAFVDTPATAWQVHDAARSIYRSTATYASGSRFSGHISLGVDPDDKTGWHPLVPYKAYNYLAADTHLYSPTAPYYLGPGIFWDSADGRIYVRLVNSTSEAMCGRTVTQIADTDPRNNKLHLSQINRYPFTIRGNHVHIRNVGVMQGFYGCYEIKDTADVPNVGFVADNNEGHPNYFIARLGNSNGAKILGGTYDAHLDCETHWVSWADVKNGVLAAQNMRSAGIDLGSATNFEIGPKGGTGNTVWFPTPDGAERITIRRFFDGISGSGHGTASTLARVHGVHFDRIVDDAWQRVAKVHRTELHDFLCNGAGPSRDASGSGNPNAIPGTNYIHHGRIVGHRVFWYRKGHPSDPDGGGWRESIALSKHGSIQGYSMPNKMWNVEIYVGISGVPKEGTYGGFGRYGGAPGGTVVVEASDERYNNLLYTLNGQPVDRDCYTYWDKEIYDGNLYYGWVSPQSIWRLFFTPGTTYSALPDVDTIRLRALPDSQAYYAPGWEANGIGINPNPDVNWNPQAAIHAGAVDIEAIHPDWPGITGYVPHRGAVAA